MTRPGVMALTTPVRCEIAVIGSGPGGAFTAALLAEAGRDVLLLEEGPYLELESCPPFSRQEMEEKYRNAGVTVALGKPKVNYVEGRCVGGGSEINSGLYHRTPPDVLERWRCEYEVEGLSDAELLPHFEACEEAVTVSRLPGLPPAASLALHEGATKLGWKSIEVPRWFRYDETAPDQVATGTRQSMTQTMIPRALAAGARLAPETRARRLVRSGPRWEILTEQAGTGSPLPPVQAEHVFVCGGAVQTPALLRRSGIRQGIGDSLQLHPTIKFIARFDREVNAETMGVPVHQVKEFAPRMSFGCSISSPPYLALGLADRSEYVAEVEAEWRRMAVFYAMITPEGRGTVRNVPGFRDALVRYRLTPGDIGTLTEGLHRLGEALFASGATDLFASTAPTARVRDAKELHALSARASNLMTIHLFSSCPMGENRDRCPVDSFGRVRGHEGLHVADASLLCTAPGVNPQGTIMALARRNALHFLGRL